MEGDRLRCAKSRNPRPLWKEIGISVRVRCAKSRNPRPKSRNPPPLRKEIARRRLGLLCGSNVLHKTTNKGKSWVHYKAVAANLYPVKFLDDNKGFVLGNDGMLLRGLG
ncbi:Photosystem II stability/assembly factor HCF136 chloroplastic [Zea mays]|uniref:Photosystem II stability/assembly factor HCF136 chloroplastic n=1 Tax=Zea mays TaxID=4577 RepID=A0A1D6E9E1_MAIZE|nr:Photosystem II stability/assembly factor HCF136 chloroplastic [Zea mays]